MTQEESKQSLSLLNDYDIQRIYSNQVECVLSDSHAVYFAQDNCEFTVIELENFTM